MTAEPIVIGIDVGSISIALTALDLHKTIVASAYAFHRGNIRNVLDALMAKFDPACIAGVAATTSTPEAVSVADRCDNRVALIEAAKHRCGRLGAILSVGGEKFGLIRFDSDGRYRDYRSNTSCAAGTGSFLDQQAGRLNLDGVEALSRTAMTNTGIMPKIASRCAVFAKTDLIHAQQEGYTIEEICDGLCHGLAKNVVDTLLVGEMPAGPVLFCGGVARNRRVAEHIEALTGLRLTTDPYAAHYESIGAAIHFIEGRHPDGMKKNGFPLAGRSGSANHILHVTDAPSENRNTHPPLETRLSSYPRFDDHERFTVAPQCRRFREGVEVDIYHELQPGAIYRSYLGIDIGSTSTKAVLLETSGTVLVGVYTRTSGRPLDSVCALFETLDQLAIDKHITLDIIGAGTTGSGRKFVGKLTGADLILDEITAHARAAFDIHPEVDTIIEIGGQDAKFTTLKNGAVTFSFMNTVCAAGTGSFIEEQAKKLGCPLSEYSTRAEKVRAPLASDRCTVFMERDINHYLSKGYRVEQVLASVLHSVRENYLRKVAVEGAIGDTILFQGATAKNKALVAAFEQRLGKPILVSRYCHLTGAIGTALTLADQGVTRSTFRGLGLYRKDIPIRSEVCDLCFNHCKLTVSQVDGDTIAYGFLCGRDYQSGQRRKDNRTGFDLITARNHLARVTAPPVDAARAHNGPTIGLPAGLYLHETLPFWKTFFGLLGFQTVDSRSFTAALKRGKQLSGAEFCAPVTAMHGHIDYLLDKADYLFMPYYLEKRQKSREWRRQYCYYSQFMPALAGIVAKDQRHRLLTPLVHYLYTPFHAKIHLYRALRNTGADIGFMEVSAAFDKAVEHEHTFRKRIRSLYDRERTSATDISVMLLGRPYSLLSRAMNKGIPNLFDKLGVKTFFQDMLPAPAASASALKPLLKEIHWNYGATILEAAETVAGITGVYPVLVTSFKCAPDSFIKEYFQHLMAVHRKPYLILELDEHDSSVGYETRIEASVRAFRNHAALSEEVRPGDYRPLLPARVKRLTDKTLVIPNWDRLTCRLLAAVFQGEGVPTVLMESSDTSIRKSLRFNSGQCIPLNAITQGFVECMENHQLNPADTALWLIASNTCSLRLYPHHVRTLLKNYGNGFDRAGVYIGEISLADISLKAAYNTYLAYMFAGLIRRIGCKLRPYERNPGSVDQAIEYGMTLMARAFAGSCAKENAVKETIDAFKQIRVDPHDRPKVAIFGDLYVRDNRIMNQDLIRFIEKHGGEVIPTPYLSYAKMVAGPYFRKWFREGLYLNVLSYKTLLAGLRRKEKYFYRFFEAVLGEPEFIYDQPPEKILAPYTIALENTGEAMDNILKVFYVKRHHPDISLFVQASPSFCCPSLITEAMADEIEKNTGVPVVSITYDGTGGDKNDALIPYLKYARPAPANHVRRISGGRPC